MFRSVVVFVALALSCTDALVATPALAASKLSASRVVGAEMFSSSKKAAPKAAKVAKKVAKKVAAKKPVAKKPVAKKPVAKKAPVKKSVSKSGSSPKGKGGIFPWVTNEPGTYAEVMNLSSMDFLGDDGDKLVGWGFMPNSVKALYPKRSSGK